MLGSLEPSEGSRLRGWWREPAEQRGWPAQVWEARGPSLTSQRSLRVHPATQKARLQYLMVTERDSDVRLLRFYPRSGLFTCGSLGKPRHLSLFVRRLFKANPPCEP